MFNTLLDPDFVDDHRVNHLEMDGFERGHQPVDRRNGNVDALRLRRNGEVHQ